MEELLTYLWNESHWAWWAVSVLLLGLEVILPTFFLLWLGVAGVVVGFVVFIFPDLGWQNEVIIYTVLSIIVTVLGRRYFRPSETKTDRPHLNMRGSELVGRILELDETFKNGQGHIKISDTHWMARLDVGNDDLKKGSKVKVVSVDGATLIVEKSE